MTTTSMGFENHSNSAFVPFTERMAVTTTAVPTRMMTLNNNNHKNHNYNNNINNTMVTSMMTGKKRKPYDAFFATAIPTAVVTTMVNPSAQPSSQLVVPMVEEEEEFVKSTTKGTNNHCYYYYTPPEPLRSKHQQVYPYNKNHKTNYMAQQQHRKRGHYPIKTIHTQDRKHLDGHRSKVCHDCVPCSSPVNACKPTRELSCRYAVATPFLKTHRMYVVLHCASFILMTNTTKKRRQEG